MLINLSLLSDSAKLTVVLEAQQQMSDTQNEILGLLQEGKRQRDYFLSCLAVQRDFYEKISQETADQENGPEQEAISALLHMEAGITESDAQQILASRELFPPNHRDQAASIVVNKSFRTWITSPVSRKLLVHGSFDGTHYVSALSYFCTTLLQALQGAGQHTTLTFFCGRHLDPNDRYAGGQGMIRSLVAQLLQQHRFDCRGLDKQVDLALAESGDIKELTLLLRSLVQRLYNMTLFCIIDGIKYYERAAYIEDMSVVLASLLDIAEEGQESRNVFKLLITSPSPTRIVRQAVRHDEILSLDIVPAVDQGFSTSQLARQIQADQTSMLPVAVRI